MKKLIIIAIIAIAVIAGVVLYQSPVMGKAINSISNLQVDDNGVLKVSNAGNSGVTLANPTNGAAATTTAGQMVGTSTVYFKITSVDYAGGQTAPSDEFRCNVGAYYTGAPDGCNVTFTPTTGAASTRVWVATTSNTYYGYKVGTSTTLIAATSSGLTAGTLPTSNTAYTNNNGFMGIQDANLKSLVTADTLIKTGPGFVHTVTYSPTDAAATAGSIAILDAVAAGNNATSTLYYVPAAALTPVTVTLDQYFSTGIYVDFTTVADVNVSISYR